MTRKPIQIVIDTDGVLIALANDGTIWVHNGVGSWEEHMPLPQPDPQSTSNFAQQMYDLSDMVKEHNPLENMSLTEIGRAWLQAHPGEKK